MRVTATTLAGEQFAVARELRARILDRFTWRRTAEGMIENWYDTLEITDHGRRARMGS